MDLFIYKISNLKKDLRIITNVRLLSQRMIMYCTKLALRARDLYDIITQFTAE